MMVTKNESSAGSQSAPNAARPDARAALIAICKSAAKRVLDVVFGGQVLALRALGVVDFPVPPNHNLRSTSSTTIRHYYESGVTTFMPIATAALSARVDLSRPVKVLDFGCGVGRQLLHLTRLYHDTVVSACDVNDDAISYVKRTFPNVHAYANSFDPPLTFGSDTFDLVYSVSIFSHLSENDARLWVAELLRVTKPGGVLCLTFNSDTSLGRSHERGWRLDLTSQKLAEQGSLFDADADAFAARKAAESVSRFGSNLIGIRRTYGEMYYSHACATRLFEETGLEVVSLLPGIIDRWQDLAVLRKSPSSG